MIKYKIRDGEREERKEERESRVVTKKPQGSEREGGTHISLELCDKVLDESVVKVLATEEGVSVG